MSTTVEASSSTQYVVFSGHERGTDVERIAERLVFPGTVTLSYRHISSSDYQFLELLLVTLRDRGMQSFSTIFAGDHEAARIQAIADRENLDYTAK